MHMAQGDLSYPEWLTLGWGGGGGPVFTAGLPLGV